MNSQPVTPAKAVKSRLKLGLILGLLLGVGGGLGACLPFVFDFKSKLESESAEKKDVLGVLALTSKNLNETTANVESLNAEVAEWKQKFDDELKERQRLEKETQQLETEIAQVKKESAALAMQIENQDQAIAQWRADHDELKKGMADSVRERQRLLADLEQSERQLKTLQSERDRSAQIPASQRGVRKDGTMTVVGMTEDASLPLDGPINTLRIANWPSKKQEGRFCYESSRNGQRITLYYNLIPFATIEHKKLQSKDMLVLSWKEDSTLFWTDVGKRNRDVTFEKMAAYQLSQNDIAFLYESKTPTREKVIGLKFEDD